MDLDEQTLQKVAKLSALYLPEDCQDLLDKFNNVLHLIEALGEVSMDNVQPLAHPIADQSQRTRTDVVTEYVDRNKMQSLAPLTEAQVYLVPPVVDQE